MPKAWKARFFLKAPSYYRSFSARSLFQSLTGKNGNYPRHCLADPMKRFVDVVAIDPFLQFLCRMP